MCGPSNAVEIQLPPGSKQHSQRCGTLRPAVQQHQAGRTLPSPGLRCLPSLEFIPPLLPPWAPCCAAWTLWGCWKETRKHSIRSMSSSHWTMLSRSSQKCASSSRGSLRGCRYLMGAEKIIWQRFIVLSAVKLTQCFLWILHSTVRKVVTYQSFTCSGPEPWASRCSWTSTPTNPGQQRWWWRLLGVVVQEHLEAQGWGPLI